METKCVVLILVLMEFGITFEPIERIDGEIVLILVLIEFGITNYRFNKDRELYIRLNPCSNGIWDNCLYPSE